MLPKNLSLRHKLRNYSVVTGALLAAGETANSQIIYHPVYPNIVIDTNETGHSFDLDGDGSADFYLYVSRHNSFYNALFYIFATGKSVRGTLKPVTFGPSHIGYPSAIGAGNKIGTAGPWFSRKDEGPGPGYIDDVLAGFESSAYIGKWNGVTNKYIGFRFKNGSAYNYGWMRCSITNRGISITISGYAYESIPDSSIIAGDSGTVTKISSPPLQDISVYSSGKHIIVKYPTANDVITITVLDILGREVRKVETMSSLYEMNLEDAIAGTYFIIVKSRAEQITKKLFIQ